MKEIVDSSLAIIGSTVSGENSYPEVAGGDEYSELARDFPEVDPSSDDTSNYPSLCKNDAVNRQESRVDSRPTTVDSDDFGMHRRYFESHGSRSGDWNPGIATTQ